jgi:hypothetical protein
VKSRRSPLAIGRGRIQDRPLWGAPKRHSLHPDHLGGLRLGAVQVAEVQGSRRVRRPPVRERPCRESGCSPSASPYFQALPWSCGASFSVLDVSPWIVRGTAANRDRVGVGSTPGSKRVSADRPASASRWVGELSPACHDKRLGSVRERQEACLQRRTAHRCRVQAVQVVLEGESSDEVVLSRVPGGTDVTA